ncbi:uncharacterized protein FIESC28_04750 [Fusarium coffeatum]|uniref:Apple domain-containing protein n=1 Tax=Fusarium coffeatum TaxID=231269 RepID=A0A366RZB1_9HYPO|nr:uncharacterized protein FIESC28_04750 [Fusarium coffeatum]RBR21760.1 hypothetical protein FIESC28_04750 [Fusarium coffeatum]
MKLFDLTLFASTAIAAACANPIPEPSPPQTVCGLTGTMGDVPTQIRTSAFITLSGFSTPEACRAKCFSAEYAKCKSFGIRQSGGGSCLLFDYDISSHIIPRQSVYTYFPLPAGIRGAVPENVAQHYRADITKTKGTYEGCRGVCLSDSRCKGFGYKDGGNCQLYDVSLEGKVKPKPDWPYIQYRVDCPSA